MDQSHPVVSPSSDADVKFDIASNLVELVKASNGVSQMSVSSTDLQDELFSQSCKDIDVIPLSPSETRAIDISVLRYICDTYSSFSLIENENFKNFMCVRNPSYTLPDHKTFDKILMSPYYEECVKEVKDQLQRAKAVFLSCEGWKRTGYEKDNAKVYAVSAHYIIDDTKFHSSFLECMESYKGYYSMDEVAKWLQNVVTNFNIGSKICGVVTDESTDLQEAADLLEWHRLPCFAHSLNSIVQGSISHLQDIIDKVRAVVRAFKADDKALEKLYKQQQAHNLPKLKLKQDISTLWKSTFEMLRRVLISKDAFLAAVSALGFECSVTPEEWEIIASVKKGLEIFDAVTSEISSEPTVPLSKAFVMSHIMLKRMESLLNERSSYAEVRKMLQDLSDGLWKIFADKEVSELICQCVFLDPRFKKWKFEEDKHAAMRKYFMNKLTSSVPESPEIKMEIDESSLWEEFDNKVAERDPPITEIDMYMKEPIVGRHESPFLWWESRKYRYPNLYQIVLEKLFIPANSIPCHTLFTKHGKCSLGERNYSEVSCSTLNKMLYINMNAKKEEGNMENVINPLIRFPS